MESRKEAGCDLDCEEWCVAVGSQISDDTVLLNTKRRKTFPSCGCIPTLWSYNIKISNWIFRLSFIYIYMCKIAYSFKIYELILLMFCKHGHIQFYYKYIHICYKIITSYIQYMYVIISPITCITFLFWTLHSEPLMCVSSQLYTLHTLPTNP